MNRYSIDDLEKLITQIRAATGLTQAEIEREVQYNPGYVSQVKTKGKVPDKLMQTLQYHFQDQLSAVALDSKRAIAVLLENSLLLRAHLDIYGGMITEILAHHRNTSAIALADEANTLLSRRLEKLKDELKSYGTEP